MSLPSLLAVECRLRRVSEGLGVSSTVITGGTDAGASGRTRSVAMGFGSVAVNEMILSARFSTTLVCAAATISSDNVGLATSILFSVGQRWIANTMASAKMAALPSAILVVLPVNQRLASNLLGVLLDVLGIERLYAEEGGTIAPICNDGPLKLFSEEVVDFCRAK